ncbi:LOW QUALITY PROTEIN: uncharacterized protein LOC117315550 [Pecten maximus]|uniref:LOW QUALITY PROTEIN: uncharacterized protein LOC117315550 n=1 Tax=Pecten maximus TaxID=6579 RepID=UPI0014587DE8|nr:LOW QUALITY PROTEIN: uncharacterized protein LOC117315550 [Pecten maximus]
MADLSLVANYRSAVLFLFILCVPQPGYTDKHGIDTSICSPSQIQNSPTPKRPSLPNKYVVSIEANIENHNYTTDYTEFYDGTRNLGATHQWFLGFHVKSIYSPGTDELFTVETQTGTCTTDNLATAGPKYIFGYQPSSSNQKVGRLFTTAGALRFGNGTNEQYMGTSRVRGIIADYWKSCMYWPDMDATMEVHWYFTNTASWDPATGRTLPSPLRCQVNGKVWSGNPHVFNHTYEFNHFGTVFPTTHPFETPAGIACPHRKDTKPLPTPSNYFVFTAETLNVDFNTIGFIKEWYAKDMNLVRYDYKPATADVSPYGHNMLTEVHDFSEGIAYIRDPTVGNCTLTTISARGIDAKSVDPNHVRIRTSQEFFNFDKAAYQYEGVRKVRGMDADVWIATRTDWPASNPGKNSTWEWYFARQGWRESTGHTYVFGMPLMLSVHSDNYGSIVYNTYNFDEEKPGITDFDISKCYNYTNRQDFAFKIPGSYQVNVAPNLQGFKYNVILAVHKAATVSSLRISDVKVDYDASNILVSLTILGTPNVQGDVNNPVTQVSLSTAATLLTNAINSNQLRISVSTAQSQNKMLTAQPYSLKQSSHTVQKGYYVPPKTKTSYSAGAVAGLGVAMAVVFFAFGFACMYIYYRKNGGSFTKGDAGGFEPKKFAENDYENTADKSGDE